jgi:hypothetical protein
MRESWEPKSFAPPLAHRKPEMRSLRGPFFFLFQKGFSEPVRLSETDDLAEISL